MTNEDLGYSDFYEQSRKGLGLADFGVARVTSEHKGAYKVKNADGEYLAKVTGKQMFKAESREDYPAVGDWVAITKLGNDQAVINGILPRMTVIKRDRGDMTRSGKGNDTQVIAANIDEAFVVESVDRDYSLSRFERYAAIIVAGGAKPVFILNKVDLLTQEELDKIIAEVIGRFPSIDVVTASAENDNGLDGLRKKILKGKTYCFLGSSGVGKSSLIGRLIDGSIRTGHVGSRSGRGKHTTTNRQLYLLSDGGIVIDNPGIRAVGIAEAGQTADDVFDEITILSKGCKFVDCTHMHEPGCEVLNALKTGAIDEERYSNYVNFKKEAEFREMNELERKQNERRFGKMKKTLKKDFLL